LLSVIIIVVVAIIVVVIVVNAIAVAIAVACVSSPSLVRVAASLHAGHWCQYLPSLLWHDMVTTHKKLAGRMALPAMEFRF